MFRASSSVVERCPDKTEVEGPIPSSRTLRIDTARSKTEGENQRFFYGFYEDTA